jgi:hypothetical protein
MGLFCIPNVPNVVNKRSILVLKLIAGIFANLFVE